MNESLPPAPPVDAERRLWLTASTTIGADGVAATAVRFVASFTPSERALAPGAPVEVEEAEPEGLFELPRTDPPKALMHVAALSDESG